MVTITAKIKTDTPITTSTTLNDLETVSILSLKSAVEKSSIFMISLDNLFKKIVDNFNGYLFDPAAYGIVGTVYIP